IGANEVKRSVKAPPLVCARAVVPSNPNSTMDKKPSLNFNPHLLPAAGGSVSPLTASSRGQCCRCGERPLSRLPHRSSCPPCPHPHPDPCLPRWAYLPSSRGPCLRRPFPYLCRRF